MNVRPVSDPPRRVLRDADDLAEALGVPFSSEQREAITAPLEPQVIIAGAGSGKTTVMAARVVWLVGTGAVHPEQVLGLTFTRKAAGELSARVRAALQRAGVIDAQGVDDAGEQLVMTYDAFAARLVTDHGLRIGFDGDPMMITGATRFRLAERVVAAAAGPFESISRLRPMSVTERVLQLDAQMQAHLVDQRRLDQHAVGFMAELQRAPLNRSGSEYASVRRARATLEERLEIVSLVAEYQRLKRELGLVEFADQMAIAAQIAADVPAVSRELREQFRVVLLDEYQDTSAAQALVLAGLFSGPDVASGRGHAVTAVGDPFQAIYGWRGAAASNILNFAPTFRRADGSSAARFALTINRRSGQSILDVANDLAAPLRADPLLHEDDEASTDLVDARLVAPPGTAPGEVAVGTFDTWPDEVAWVAARAVAAHTSGEAARWSDIAMLLRRNADIGPLHAALTALEVPCEIVGLGGLLALPEVQDVMATLAVIDDPTANPALVRILTGPRWAIGPADLAMLGRRAADLARGRGEKDAETDSLTAALDRAVSQVDPAEVVSLVDALDDPGERPFSPEARHRFAALAAELRVLRAHVGDPLLDLVRRVIAILGVDVEVSASSEFARRQRRVQLATFIDAVAGYVELDGEASLSGLLDWLGAELDHGTGLDLAVPTQHDSIKLLTVHKAKGLEWDVVFVPALVKDVFPSDRVSDNWLKAAAALPAPLRGDAAAYPQVGALSHTAIEGYGDLLKNEQRRAEDRLAYVAVTRARRLLHGTAHHWRVETKNARQVSDYFHALAAEARRQGRVLAEAAVPGEENPLDTGLRSRPWPEPYDPASWEARRRAAAQVAAHRAGEVADESGLLLDDAEIVAAWDADLTRLLAEARAARCPIGEVRLPGSLSATALMAATRDPGAFASGLLRPMPRAPLSGARLGVLFHAWVEQRSLSLGLQTQAFLVDEEDLPDEEPVLRHDFETLCRAFDRGPYAKRVPVAVEAPFTLVLGDQLVKGRIDAIYPGEREGTFQVVDWKTSRHETPDPVQLAIYREAWAEIADVDARAVDAVFCFVRSGRVQRPELLPSREELLAWARQPNP